jgi:hypothetical protein
MPPLQKENRVFFDQFSQLPDFSRIIANGPLQRYGRQPEFGRVLRCFNVNVGWFMFFFAEEESMWATVQDRWHKCFLRKVKKTYTHRDVIRLALPLIIDRATID